MDDFSIAFEAFRKEIYGLKKQAEEFKVSQKTGLETVGHPTIRQTPSKSELLVFRIRTTDCSLFTILKNILYSDYSLKRDFFVLKSWKKLNCSGFDECTVRSVNFTLFKRTSTSVRGYQRHPCYKKDLIIFQIRGRAKREDIQIIYQERHSFDFIL